MHTYTHTQALGLHQVVQIELSSFGMQSLWTEFSSTLTMTPYSVWPTIQSPNSCSAAPHLTLVSAPVHVSPVTLPEHSHTHTHNHGWSHIYMHISLPPLNMLKSWSTYMFLCTYIDLCRLYFLPQKEIQNIHIFFQVANK